MKKIIFLIFFVLLAKSVQAQNSDLYDYIMNVVKPTHLSGSNILKFSKMYKTDLVFFDNQPVLVVDDIPREVANKSITKFDDLNSYTRADVYAVYVWKNRDIRGLGYGTKGKNCGVIFVYTTAYASTRPLRANQTVPFLQGNNNVNKIVVFQAP